jgi:hypothetical protein
VENNVENNGMMELLYQPFCFASGAWTTVVKSTMQGFVMQRISDCLDNKNPHMCMISPHSNLPPKCALVWILLLFFVSNQNCN